MKFLIVLAFVALSALCVESKKCEECQDIKGRIHLPRKQYFNFGKTHFIDLL